MTSPGIFPTALLASLWKAVFAVVFAILPMQDINTTNRQPALDLGEPLLYNGDEGDEPRMGVARVPFWSGAQFHPNQIAVPVSPRQTTRDYSRAGRPVDLWGVRVAPGFLSRPLIP